MFIKLSQFSLEPPVSYNRLDHLRITGSMMPLCLHVRYYRKHDTPLKLQKNCWFTKLSIKYLKQITLLKKLFNQVAKLMERKNYVEARPVCNYTSKVIKKYSVMFF